MKRIIILGCAGSGKSTLAFQVQQITVLPLYHLDQYYWKPHWQMPIFEDFKAVHDDLCDRDAWIIEGMSAHTLLYRIIRADCVIFLDVPRKTCLWRVFKRVMKNYNICTASSAIGCPERFSFAFMRWIWGFKKRTRPYIMDLLSYYMKEKKIFIISSQSDKEEMIKKIKILTTSDVIY